MAKTIKFNLICDNKSIRGIEDLQNNFSVEDVLDYYNNKLLHRWLKVRGFNNYLTKVEGIKVKDKLEIIKELIKIFEINTENLNIEESIYMIEFTEKRKELLNIYEKNKFKVKEIIDDYKIGYFELLKDIDKNSSNMDKIKANIAEMVSSYPMALSLNYREIFYRYIDESMLVIYLLLMNSYTRNFYIPIEEDVKNINDLDKINMSEKLFDKNKNLVDLDFESEKALSEEYNSIFGNRFLNEIINKSEKYEINSETDSELKLNDLTKFFNIYSGETQGYWKDLKPKGKKYMILSIERNNFVRSAGNTGGDLGFEEINNRFVILDGIDYKSNFDTDVLVYMEV